LGQEAAYRAFDYSGVARLGWPVRQRVARWLLTALFRLLVRMEVAGLEHLPAEGPFLLVANHLHALDPAIGLLLVPHRVVGVAKDKWARAPFSWLLESMGDLVYVGERRRGSVGEMLDALRGGRVVAILPEGTRSPTGALVPAHRGMALLATRTGVPVVPCAAWGQERAGSCWLRLRRVPVRARVGPPIVLPQGPHDRRSLQELTDGVMRVIAGMLPPQYRGVYEEQLPT
jgi:1-acyl-sn-glycerol-3-phosphate acyltransferase